MIQHKGTVVIDTRRLILRPFVPEDGDPMFRNWASDGEVTKFLTWPVHESEEVSRHVVEQWCGRKEDPKFYQWAIELKEIHEPIGSISAVRIDERTGAATIGYCIGRRWWGQGITAEALRAVIEFFFEEVGMNCINACHDPRNPNSGKVMKKCGMTKEGTWRAGGVNNQGICDETWYSILREQFYACREASGRQGQLKEYDVIIIGAGPGGIFSAYELTKKRPELKVAVLEAGHGLDKRRCPIDGEQVKACVKCKSCSIMSGFGGAGAFSDGKYNITNDFGGTLYKYIGKNQALELMCYVDEINMCHGGQDTRLYTTAGTKFKKLCMQNDLHLLDASVRHLGTDVNYVVLKNLYEYLKTKVHFFFDTPAESVYRRTDGSGYEVRCREAEYFGRYCIISVGRSGSKWMEKVCGEMGIGTKSNRVDIGVRVELPAEIFSHLTDELYESKIVYRTPKYGDLVRTFCMNPKGAVVSENTNGIVTVNGHSYEDPEKHTENTNFALLVAKHFSEPFKDSNGYGESIARLSNMLGGGVIVQRFGDLIRGQRSTQKRIEESFTTPTLNATPGDLSLVLPKRLLDGIIEMIYALDKIAPGTANDDTLLYGVEVKFYNMEVEVDEHLQTEYEGLYIIGDGSGITHSLSHASASGVYVAREIGEKA